MLEKVTTWYNDDTFPVQFSGPCDQVETKLGRNELKLKCPYCVQQSVELN